jgi:tetratricopeptide (TPR) repeat protein
MPERNNEAVTAAISLVDARLFPRPVRMRQQQREEGIAESQRAIEQLQDWTVVGLEQTIRLVADLLLWVETLLDLHRLEQACATSQRLLDLLAPFIEGGCNDPECANCRALQQQPDEDKSDLQLLWVIAWHQHGRILLAQDKYPEAQGSLVRASKAAFANDRWWPHVVARIFLDLGQAWSFNQQPGEALEVFDLVATLLDREEGAIVHHFRNVLHFRRGYALVQLGHLVEGGKEMFAQCNIDELDDVDWFVARIGLVGGHLDRSGIEEAREALADIRKRLRERSEQARLDECELAFLARWRWVLQKAYCLAVRIDVKEALAIVEAGKGCFFAQAIKSQPRGQSATMLEARAKLVAAIGGLPAARTRPDALLALDLELGLRLHEYRLARNNHHE